MRVQFATVILLVSTGLCIAVYPGHGAETSIFDEPVDLFADDQGVEFVAVSSASGPDGIWILVRAMPKGSLTKTQAVELWQLDNNDQIGIRIDLGHYLGPQLPQYRFNAAVSTRDDGSVILAIVGQSNVFEFGFSAKGELEFENLLDRTTYSGLLQSIDVVSPYQHLLVFSDGVFLRSGDADSTHSWYPEDYWIILRSVLGSDKILTILLLDTEDLTSPPIVAQLDPSTMEWLRHVELPIPVDPEIQMKMMGFKLVQDIRDGVAIVMPTQEGTLLTQIFRFDSQLRLMNEFQAAGIPFDQFYRYGQIFLAQDLMVFLATSKFEGVRGSRLWLGLYANTGNLLSDEVSASALQFELVKDTRLVFAPGRDSFWVVSNVKGTNDVVNDVSASFIRIHRIQTDKLMDHARATTQM